MGVAMSWECGCSSEAPAASPWFLNTLTYSKRWSFWRSTMRSRQAPSTAATCVSGSVARVARWSGDSMITSCAPMPLMRSYSPSPVGSSSPSIRRAGNLLGTTRTDHPGELGALLGSRTARISSGVRASWPAQKAQGPAPTGRAGAVRKSEGRRERSVGMITQRPTIGSRRSSGTDGALLLGPRLPREESLKGVAHRAPVEEHGGHLLADGHGHALGPGEGEGRRDGAHALGDHGRRALDLGQ